MVVPGVSGGVLAVIFGVYDKMIYSLTNLFKSFKKNFTFLFILGLGILVGVIWFSNVMMFLYKSHEVITKFSFIGLILGGVPYLFKIVKNKKEKINFLVITLTILLSFSLWMFSSSIFNIDLDKESSSIIINYINLFIAGIIYSIGKVIPGISGSFLLIIIGMYEYVLSIMAHPIKIGLMQLDKLIPFIIGMIVGVILLLKLINYLLNKHFGLTYSIIIGFVIGSVPAIIPSFDLSLNLITCIVAMISCFILSYKLTK